MLRGVRRACSRPQASQEAMQQLGLLPRAAILLVLGYGQLPQLRRVLAQEPAIPGARCVWAEFRLKHANAHKTGRMPNGAPRNLSVPTHVPWTGGVMHRKVDLSVKWETGLNGMRSSTGETEVLWRAWESKEQNLARGVKPESMPK